MQRIQGLKIVFFDLWIIITQCNQIKSPVQLRNCYGTLPKNIWCPDSELNQGHGDFQSPALPTELSGHIFVICNWWAIRDLNPGPAGYEPDALTN